MVDTFWDSTEANLVRIIAVCTEATRLKEMKLVVSVGIGISPPSEATVNAKSIGWSAGRSGLIVGTK